MKYLLLVGYDPVLERQIAGFLSRQFDDLPLFAIKTTDTQEEAISYITEGIGGGAVGLTIANYCSFPGSTAFFETLRDTYRGVPFIIISYVEVEKWRHKDAAVATIHLQRERSRREVTVTEELQRDDNMRSLVKVVPNYLELRSAPVVSEYSHATKRVWFIQDSP